LLATGAEVNGQNSNSTKTPPGVRQRVLDTPTVEGVRGCHNWDCPWFAE